MLEGYIQALIDLHEQQVVPENLAHIKRSIDSRVNELKNILDFYKRKCKIEEISTSMLIEELANREEVKSVEVKFF